MDYYILGYLEMFILLDLEFKNRKKCLELISLLKDKQDLVRVS